MIGLGLQKKAGTASREMDIITSTRYIECKNVNWSRAQHDVEFVKRIKSGFASQLDIAKKHGKLFEIRSKQPFTDSWKIWLKEQGIKYIEG